MLYKLSLKNTEADIDVFQKKALKDINNIAGSDVYNRVCYKLLLLFSLCNGQIECEDSESKAFKAVAERIQEDALNVKMVFRYLLGEKIIKAEKTSKSAVASETTEENQFDANNVEPVEIKNEKKEKGEKRFVPPTIEEIEDYLLEAQINGVNAEEFYDYYESIGWKVGKNRSPMKDWKATVRRWNRSPNNDNSAVYKNNSTKSSMEQLFEVMNKHRE